MYSMKRSYWDIIMFLMANCYANKPCYIIFFINLLLLSPCKVVGQTSNSSLPPSDNESDFPTSGTYHFSPAMSVIFVIIVVVFFLVGCFSVFGRNCIESRNQRSGLLEINQVNRRSRRTGEGLESDVINTFPTFLYSDVKKVKIGGKPGLELECAICLNEFKEDETLRLVPKCCHVFHPECIDTWLTSHATCPVCRADLAPVPGGTGTINCNLLGRLNSEEDEPSTTRLDQEENDFVLNSPSHQGRSHSAEDSLIQANNNYERYTLRLPEDVQKKLMKPELRRAKSNLVFPVASSSKRGYRSSSVGPSLQIHNSHQQSTREDRWGFTMAPPFLVRSSSVQAPIGGDEGNVVMASGSSSKPNKSAFEWLFSGSRSKDEAGERSSAKLMGNDRV